MAKIIQVAFFKALYSNVLSKTVKLLDSDYTHIELIIKDNWYGSNINLLGTPGITKLNNPTIKQLEWDIVDISVSDNKYYEIKDLANKLVGSGYSFLSNMKRELSKSNIVLNNDLLSLQYILHLLISNKVISNKLTISELYDELNKSEISISNEDLTIDNFKRLRYTTFSLENIYLKW